MGVTHCFKPALGCGSRRRHAAQPTPPPAPTSANIIGNSNFSNKTKILNITGQLNAQLIGNVAVPLNLINIGGNQVQVPILSNNAIALLGIAVSANSNTASGGNVYQPVLQANNQNNDG